MIKCGSNSTGFLTLGGNLYVCGLNNCGQLGLGQVNNVSLFTKVEPFDNNIKDFGFGLNHSIVLTKCNSIYSCGGWYFYYQVLTISDNMYGQLGFNDTVRRNVFTKINLEIGYIEMFSCGGHHVMLYNRSGELYSFGRYKHQ